MEEDSRAIYIANIVGAIFGTNQFQKDILSSPKVQEFLNDLNCTSLECVTNGSKVKFILNSFNNIEAGYQDVHFLKRQLAEITASNIADQLLVSTMRHSPTDSLYQYMKAVYEPLLVGESSTAANMNPQMKNLVTSLKAGLATTLRLGSHKRSAEDESSLEGILSPVDEIEFWSDMEKLNVQSGTDEKLRQKAENLNKHFSKIAKPLYEIDSMKLVKVNDLLDALYDTMDFIWTDSNIDPPYGELRMKHFIKICTATIGAKVEKELNDMDVWASSFSDVRMKLNETMKICRAWKDKIADLTGTLWKAESNKWTGGAYYDPYLERLINRLTEIFELRSQHDELMRLLSPEDQVRLNVESAFDPFRDINCFYHNEFQSSQWNRAKAKYQDNLAPMENELCEKLRKEIFAEKCEPTQRLREFQRWKGLLSMTKIKEQLKGERSSLLTELTSYISSLSADFESKSDSKSVDRPPLVNNMSRIVNDIVWARQLTSSKVIATQKVAESLFADLDGIDSFKSACKDLVSETKEYEKRLFNKWLADIQNLLKNKRESLELTGRIMAIEVETGLLKIQYNEKKIVTLIKDVRQLTELGYKIPKQLNQIIENVRKFYREGVTLRQVANHFNNMSTQIMECHSTMLLRHILKFEQIIKSKSKDGKDSFGKEAKDVTWTSPVELEEYIQEVQEASNNLIKENRKLRKTHMTIIENIVSLMNTDLLKSKDIWKEKLDLIKRTLDSSNYSAKETKQWRIHLDYQLYKALEYQYQVGLKNLNENFNMIEADLVYLDKTVSFRPPMEQLKSRYYKEISNFIDYPLKFTGLGGKPSIFRIIPNRNSESLLQVYSKADEVFARLDKMINTFVPWTAVGYFDLETYIEQHFKDVKDWDNNFKMLRVKRKQLEKLNESYKIDSFFNIRTEPFKRGIEDLFHRTHDTLKNTIKAAIKADMEAIDVFIDDGMKKLNARPQSVEEIGAAKAAAVEISGKKNDFVELYQQCEERNRVLQQVSGEGAFIGEMQNRWENFDVALNAFSSMIDEQKNVLKQETDKRVSVLNSELEKTYNRWEALKPKERSDMDRETAMETSEKMKEWREKWDDLETKIKNITADCEHFGMERPQLNFYEELKNDLAKQEASWRMYDEFYTELAELGKEDWLSFSRGKGIYQFQDFMDKWAEKIKQAGAAGEANEGMQLHASVKKLLNQAIDNFRESWPLFKICVGEAFEKEHWRGLFYMLEFPKEVTVENLKFIHFLDHIENMVKKQAEIRDLGARAQGEVSLREAIQELRAWCDETVFSLTDYVGANNRTVPLIKDWKELMNQVSDNQSLLISLKESRFFSRFSDQVEQFESKLTGIDEYLQKLNVIQRKWVYLEPIFIRGALPAEQARFNRVDGEYVSIMMGIGMNPKVVALCDIGGLKDTLDTILSQLDVCQKALNDYLEEKRSKFPRFYFIGDDDLLEILGQATNPTVIQTHLKKLFAGIHRVDFSKDNSAIVAMKSSAGEVVELSAPVQITEDVEIWLGDLVNEMRQTLNLILKTTLNTPNLDIVNTPSQVCCLAEMIHFSNNTISAIKKGKLSNYKIDLQKSLESYTSFDHAGDMLLLSKLKALTLDIIHNIEIVDILINNGVKNTGQWGWLKQLKYSIDPRKDICNVGMCDAIFDYTFEYQGNAPKLVHTPLTDKCYLTLTQGMKMGYGGNPYGPAGTGKTESVKALGQAFGRQVLVFNCDEGIDFKSMGRIFIGLVKCGAWGCFDEFNRLLEEQLSAISQQIQVIQWAIKQGEPTLELLNRTIEVNKNAGIFVTMNPAGKGYGGRSKLPDNLKQLFRPVAMSAPDNELIAEVLLFAEGFKSSKQLAQKLIPLFTLSKQLLSPQQHYDWGLRALKTILTVGGQLIQKEKAKKKDLTFNNEALILIKAIRINTMSKLTFGDSKKFEFLLNDMFPGINVEDIVYEDLEKAINETLTEQKLEKNPKQLSKMLQFHEATNQRMGVVIVGPSGCGKSTIWKVLKKSYEKLGIQMSMHVMNPKSMPRQQLLGEMDHDTREFKDGVLTESARQVVKEPQETRCWIICDGDIDPEWIESLNSVLDDNHLLTLPNGERISFGDNVNFIFESDNLKFASPATVSRMGMIFLSEEDVNVSRLIHTWVQGQEDESMKSKLEAWMDEIFYKALDWVLKNEDKWVIETTKVGIVHTVLCSLNLIDTKAAFVDGIIRGLGGNLDIATRKELATLVFQLSNERPADPANILNNYYDPKSSSFKSFVFDYKDQDFTIEDMKNSNKPPLIPTISAQRDAKMIEGWFNNDKPFILVGPEGCGKNLIINSIIKTLKSTTVSTIHCNAQTSAFHIIQKLNQTCTQSSKSHGRVYRPKDSQKLVIYLKDINLPKPDKYDTIQLIAFLHQIVCYNGFYDENLEFVYLERIQIIASMTPATVVGRHKLSCRFTANVCIAYIEDPPADELESIYAIYLKVILNHENYGSGAMANSSKKIARYCVDTYENIKQKFSVDDFRHYLLTPKELTSWVLGLMRYEAQGAESLVEALTYEGFRMFRDRLVNIESRQALDQLMYNQLRTHLKYGQTLGSIFFLSKVSTVKPIFAGHKTLGRLEKTDLEATIRETIKSYEREYKELDVILVDELLEKFAQLERSLSQSGGHVLLAGRSGTGRRTSCQLISHMLDLKFETPKVSKEYTLSDFKKYLKQLLIESGIEDQKMVLFVEDHQMCEPEFFEYLNSLISAGEIPGLFAPEEIDPLLTNLQDELRNEYECRTVYELFVTRVSRNLRIVLSLDCKHPDFLSNCSSNPALTTKCNVIWSDAWSKGSMSKVLEVQLEETLKNLEISQDEISSLIMQMHITCIDHGATPLHFFQFIDNFKHILNSKISSQSGESKHLIAGLDKLLEAAELVDQLSQKAQGQKILLKDKQAEADAALDKINVALEKKADRKQEAEKLKKRCLQDEDIIKDRKVLIEEELVDIMPEVEAAQQKVGQLSQQNLTEIKSFKVPPDPVHDVLGAVLMMMGVKDTTWGNMKKFLSQRGVVQNILNFDAHYVTKDIRDAVNKMISKKKTSFEEKVIRAASVATAPLAAWVIANVKYSEVLLKIEPLEREMNGLMAELHESQTRVAECTQQLQELEDSTKILNTEMRAKTNEAAELRVDLERAEKMLHSAQNLLLQLSGEKDRWEIQVQEIQNNIKLLPYKSLLSAGYIIYTGKDDEKNRHNKLSEWKQMLKYDQFDFIKFMVTESQLLKWKTEGLPADELSMENAIMLRNSVKTPMIFDPATQATEWLKSCLKNEENAVEFLTQNDPKYNTKLEISIRFGKICVIEEVDGIDKMLFPVLRKDLIHQGPRWVVQCGDKVVDYNDGFRLFFATRDSLLDIPPNAEPLVVIVNFTVTKSGLESQLLSITINFEEPELEKKKTELLQEEENFKIKLAEYQKSLLDELANSSGNILENKQLVDSLNNTKTQAAEIEKALTESHKFQESLDTQRNIYRSFAAIGADLFMVIEDLVKVNNMYQFSLAAFIKMFTKALESKPSASSTDEKLKLLSDTLIKLVFFEIGRSLFKDDRLVYGLHFVHGIFSQLFQENEWEFFSGTVVAPSESSQPFPRWATPDRKSMFNSFASLFPKLIRTLQLENDEAWRSFATSAECEKEFHTSIRNQITPFQRLLVIKTFRPDRLESAMDNFVCEALSKKTIAPAPLSLKSLYENDTDCLTPILFITSPGSDPSDELQEFAAMEVGRQGYHELAMGGGENQIAIELIKDAAEKGEWVCLKNLHLVTPWLATLEKEFKFLTPDKKFRLWLTSEPHLKFPSILLKSSLTVTYESPPGIKNSLQRTYQSWAPSFDEGNVLKAQILFILAWFNSVIQERRKYIPQGWSKYYEFSYGDLKAGETILSEIIESNQGSLPQWDIVHGLLENAIYGGRVDNPFDMRVLKTYLKQFFTNDVFQGSKKLSNMIQVPKAATIREYIQYIAQLPDHDHPAMFGLPPNIDRSVQRFNSQRYINTLKTITAVSKEDLKFDREMWAKALGPILKLWKSIYKPDGFRSLKIKPAQLNSEDPVEAFTFMEAQNMLATLQKINETLSSIARVIKGSGMLTSKIESEATALLKREVPESWCKFWEGPENPQDWLVKFERKASALLTWVERSQSGGLLESNLDLSDLFHPETFFNALRQKSGRVLKSPIDDLKLVSTFENKQMGGKISVHLEGMYLQGAAFAGGRIIDPSGENLQEIIALPPCTIAWVKKSDSDPYSDGTTVSVPVYFSIVRESLLCELQVPNSGSSEDRIISGVAMFLDGSD